MRLDDFLLKLELNTTPQNRVIKRLQTLGIPTEGDTVPDDEAEKILEGRNRYIQFEQYLSNKRIFLAVPFAEARIVQELKLLFRKYCPGVLIPYVRLAFVYAPNTNYFAKEDTALVDRMLQIYLSIVSEDHSVEGISLHSLPAAEQASAIKRLLNIVSESAPQTPAKAVVAPLGAKPEIEELWYTPQAASKKYDFPVSVLKENIQNGKIDTQTIDNVTMISSRTLDFMAWQRENYIGIIHFLEAFCNERFSVSRVSHRNKFYDFWEANDFFDMDIWPRDAILFEKTGNNFLYIHKGEWEYFSFVSEEFLTEFGFSEDEKINHILNNERRFKRTVSLARAYVEHKSGSEPIVPSLTEMIRYVFRAPKEFPSFTKEDLLALKRQMPTKLAEDYLIDFADFVKSREKVSYPAFARNKSATDIIYKDVSAYPFDIVCRFAGCLFNESFIADNLLVKKALENSFFAEMWMFCSLHYVCGWRAGDICEKWMYLSLDNKSFADIGFPQINPASLMDDILTGKISDQTYAMLTDYVVDKITLAAQLPSKTSANNPNSLHVSITKSLKSHFGRLLLIAEYHRRTSGEGYMKSGRATRYLNRVRLSEFFGPEIKDIFGNQNLSSRRLNKSYLQGIERASRDLGVGSMVAHRVAAYARNHKTGETTFRYLSDHNLFHESPEFVLWSMFERGVMGAIPYALMNAAFPDVFQQLSVSEQTQLIKSAGVPSYALELAYSSEVATAKLREAFLQGSLDEPKRLLRAMYQIGQGLGKAKEDGAYCLKRALGDICEHPTWESCIANNCPYNVFTYQGIPALMDVIRHYRDKMIETGNKKYGIVLKEVILPNFQDILRSMKQEMPKEDWVVISGYLKEGLQ